MRISEPIVMSLVICLAGGGCRLFRDRKPEIPAESPAVTIRQLQEKVAAQQKEILQLQERLENLQGFSADREQHLVQVERAEFGRYTRPYDENGDGLDDGLRIYLVLYDKTGDQIKAAGDVKIELWDLAAPEGRRLLGQWVYGLEELGDHWLGGFMTDHYKFMLPWPKDNPPQNAELTLKLHFRDALTGKGFEIQKLITVAVLRPEKAPASN